jgi:hypothetical protein
MKILLPLIACSLAAALGAAPTQSVEMPPEPNPCTPLIPECRSVMFELYGEFLYLQPNGSDLAYAVEAIPFDTSLAVPAISPNWRVFEVDPSYHPAFEIGIKSFFTNSKTNLAINWERLHTDDSASETVPLTRNMIGPLFDIGPNSTAYSSAKGKATFEFDEAHLVFGQQFCFMDRLRPNVYAGAVFARIKQSLDSEYISTSGTTSRTVDMQSTFTGGGPQVGVNFDYRIAGGFSFTGNSAISLIMGSLKNHTSYQSFSPALNALSIPQPNSQSTTVPDRAQLVPGFEEQLGFSYSGVFDCWRLSLEVGYRTQIYLNAIQSIDMTAPQVLPSLTPALTVDAGVYAVGFERTLSNFILTGPYASLSIDF